VPTDVARRPIRKLDPLLVNQIAAGEVVERPASVVKELVENSLDAGATRIRVELELGGIELIRVTDDGSGIPADELATALAAHATSKIAESEDLDRIATMGFRGEALASITSVARVTIRSRPKDADTAAEISAEGAEMGEVLPASGPVGTSITVRNLFFNTPARRKFLKTPTTERSRCLEWIRDLAIANPAVGFVAVGDGKELLDLPAGQSPRERVLDVLGRELESQLLDVSADEFDDSRGMALWGLVGRPTVARANSKAIRIFLNGRVIKDGTIQHALRDSYRGLMEPGRYPTAVLMLEMSPTAVDVNVHPAKLEVRFRDRSLVHSVVHRAVRDALRAADLTPAIDEARPRGIDGGGFGGGFGGGGVLPGGGTASASTFVERFKQEYPAAPAQKFDYAAMKESLSESNVPPPPPPAPRPEHTLPQPARRESMLQVHNSFVVTQDEHGVVIVDQHALHERVMFEQLLERVRKGPLETQSLLAPAVVECGPSGVGRLDELKPLFEKIGISAEPLSPSTVGVHAFPTFLFERRVDPSEFVGEVLDKADRDDIPPDDEEALRKVLDMMSCKAAIKAGDQLSETELGELLALRGTVERSSSCPHGRPTSVRLTMEQLERLFHRQ